MVKGGAWGIPLNIMRAGWTISNLPPTGLVCIHCSIHCSITFFISLFHSVFQSSDLRHQKYKQSQAVTTVIATHWSLIICFRDINGCYKQISDMMAFCSMHKQVFMNYSLHQSTKVCSISMHATLYSLNPIILCHLPVHSLQ